MRATVQNELTNRCNGARHLTLVHLNDGNFDMPAEEEWGDKHYDQTFYKAFWNVVRSLMAKLHDRRQAKQSLLTFLQRRHERVSSGSATDSSIMVEGEEVRGNKRTWAESWTAEEMAQTLRTKEPR